MRLDGWFNPVRSDGTQPSGYPRDYAKELKSMYWAGALFLVGLVVLLIVSPSSRILVFLLPLLVTGLVFSALQVRRLRHLT